MRLALTLTRMACVVLPCAAELDFFALAAGALPPARNLSADRHAGATAIPWKSLLQPVAVAGERRCVRRARERARYV